MPQVLAMAAVGAGLIAGARWMRRRLLEQEVRRKQADLAQRGAAAKSGGRLEIDPETGVYRPE